MKYRNKVQFQPSNHYHVYNRSINNEIIFPDDEHKQIFLGIMERWLGPFVKIKSFAILRDHYHMVMHQRLVTPLIIKKIEKLKYIPAKNYLENRQDSFLYSLFISCLYKGALQEYVEWFNAIHNRKGPLFQGRYKRKEISKHTLRYVIAYVHNNPRHHKLVEHVSDWQFSSHNDPKYQDWVKEFKETAIKENPESFYNILLDTVQKMKDGIYIKVPTEIWSRLHCTDVEEEKLLVRETRYLHNFDSLVIKET